MYMVWDCFSLMESINAKYVSQKISKTRWRPVSQATLQQPDIFVTGSWDNEVGKCRRMLFSVVIITYFVKYCPGNVYNIHLRKLD